MYYNNECLPLNSKSIYSSPQQIQGRTFQGHRPSKAIELTIELETRSHKLPSILLFKGGGVVS